MRILVALLLTMSLGGCIDALTTDPEVIPDEWPEGKIRLQPGSQLYFVSGNTASQCTAGFLFASADNQTLYLSTSAHCLQKRGTGMDVYDRMPGLTTKPIGTVAFDGWHDGESTVNDFALVAISNREGVREATSPEVKHWGGPNGVATSQLTLPGTRVSAYGASETHGADHPSNPIQGYFGIDRGDLVVKLDDPAIPGDSGGPLLDASGNALGLLSGYEQLVNPITLPQWEVFAPVDSNLARAEAALGPLRLATA